MSFCATSGMALKLLSMTWKALHDLYPSYCSSLGFLTVPQLAIIPRAQLPKPTSPFSPLAICTLSSVFQKCHFCPSPFPASKIHLLQEAALTFPGLVLFCFLFLSALLAPRGFSMLRERNIAVSTSFGCPTHLHCQGFCYRVISNRK